MKKVNKAFAVFTAAAALFGFAACSDGGGSHGGEVESLPYAGPESVVTPAITAPETAGTITMNGTQYSSIQEALNAATTTGDYTITLTAGTYAENKLTYNGAGNIKISGVAGKQYGTDVVIKGWGDNSSTSTEKTRCTLEFIGTASNSLVLENLTLQNPRKRSEMESSNTQAEALGFDSDGTCAAYNCSFLSHQDTIRTIGKSWFYGCYIEGDVDFMWMEKTGKVALYENCAIKSVSDDTTNAYILAPGMNAADNVNKGLVVYNSAVKAEMSNTYLFRNPWGESATLYNSGAFVNVIFDGSFHADLQKSNASDPDNCDAVGWKVDKDIADKFTSKNAKVKVISEAVEKAEYNGRTRIINRIYKQNPGKYANDASVWDVNKLASDNGWAVVEDKSKLDEVNGNLKADGVYKIAEYATDTTKYAAIADGTSTDGFVSWTGIQYHDATYGTVVNGSSATGTISIDVAGDSIVSFMASTYANGTMRVTDEAGTVVLDTYSTKPDVDKTAIAFAYAGPATKLTITISGTTYIGDITVSPSDGETQRVKAVKVIGDDTVVIGSTITLTAKVTSQYCAPTTVTWISSDEAIATVSNGTVTGVAEGEVTITATSTFDTTKSSSMKVAVSAGKSVKLTWLDNTDDSFAGASSDETMATAGNAVPVTTSKEGTAGSYAYNSSKGSGSEGEKGGVTLTTTDASPEKGEWYIEYPITAASDIMVKKATIIFGNAGTDNFRDYVVFVDENGEESVICDSEHNPRKVTVTYNIEKAISKGKTAKLRIGIHSLLNDDGTAYKQTFSGKSPTWCDTTIVCLDNFNGVSENKTFNLKEMLSDCSTGDSASTGNAGLLSYTGMYYNSNAGAWFYKATTLSFDVKGACTITLGREGNGSTTFEVSANGENSQTLDVKNSDQTYTYSGTEPATITIKLTDQTSQAYLTTISVAF